MLQTTLQLSAKLTSKSAALSKGISQIERTFGSNAASHEEFLAQLQIQECMLEKYTRFCILCESLGRVPPFYDEFCAHKIQATWHCYRARKALKATLESFADARARGAKATNYLAREHERYSVALLRKNRDVAASRIQRMWRRFWYRKVFLFLRDLIRARETSDCRAILKVINPRESQLVDTAAGVHIRFRLGGPDFPPTLYYKVFVHRPTIDIGSFAPRNYVNPCDPRKEKCYRRFENNGWRPALQQSEPYEIFNDAVYLKSTSVRIHYPPLPKQRREEKEKLKKQKRVEWMRKLYQLNLLNVSNSEGVADATSRSGQLTRHDSITFGEEDGPDDVLVWWASALDFEQYSKDWAVLATAATFETQKQGRKLAGQPITDELGRLLGRISPSMFGEEDDDQEEFGAGLLSTASSRASSAKHRDMGPFGRTGSPSVLLQSPVLPLMSSRSLLACEVHPSYFLPRLDDIRGKTSLGLPFVAEQ
ncbi:hypothetical protein BCR44DRAFT_1144646 [Catenaria anguillulae PL171]|uniref:Uncharacterized protein n=1 Tax=Catenaria anguillulae PL171 TaxID=765915 RepID=A0A1Y2H3W9_9FUNG|nr:hypothetical protein BCR44DRAFT_1144646 [Catenaria anguillulae PL171]